MFFSFRDVENQNTKCDFEPLLASNIMVRKSHKLSHSDYHAGATILQSIEKEVSASLWHLMTSVSTGVLLAARTSTLFFHLPRVPVGLPLPVFVSPPISQL